MVARFCYYIIEITDIILKGLAVAVTCIAGKEGTRQTKGHKWGKAEALVRICKVTAQVIQSHLWKPEKAALFYAIVRLAFTQLPSLALLALSAAESVHE